MKDAIEDGLYNLKEAVLNGLPYKSVDVDILRFEDAFHQTEDVYVLGDGLLAFGLTTDSKVKWMIVYKQTFTLKLLGETDSSGNIEMKNIKIMDCPSNISREEMAEFLEQYTPIEVVETDMGGERLSNLSDMGIILPGMQTEIPGGISYFFDWGEGKEIIEEVDKRLRAVKEADAL